MWESKQNQNGGHVAIRLKGLTWKEMEDVWLQILLALIGDTFVSLEKVIGVRAVFKNGVRLELWFEEGLPSISIPMVADLVETVFQDTAATREMVEVHSHGNVVYVQDNVSEEPTKRRRSRAIKILCLMFFLNK